MITKSSLLKLVVSFTLILLWLPSNAQYPSKPVRIIQPYAVGGSNDRLSRIVAQKISENTGKALVVENHTGAGGRIGYELAAKSPPDGYTIIANDPAYTMLPALYGSALSWDPTVDLIPVSKIGEWPFVLVVSPKLKVSSLEQFITLAKANPGKYNYGSSGNGALVHVATELFAREAGLNLVHVPYKGMGEAVTALLGGSIDMIIVGTSPVVPHIKNGTLVALAMASSKRSAVLPEVPTSAEAGLPEFVAGSWIGLAAPKGTPHETILWLQKEVAKAVSSPDVKKSFASQGVEPSGVGSSEFSTMMNNESKRWSDVIRAAGIKAN